YRRSLALHVLPALGRKRLAAIAPSDVRALVLAWERQGLSPSRVRNILAPLRAMLAEAREDGLVTDNVAVGIRLPPVRRGEDERAKALTPAELRALIAAVPHGWPRLLVRFTAATGMRI